MQTSALGLIIGFGCLFGLALLSLWKMGQESQAIHDGISAFRTRAENCNKEELPGLRRELVAFYKAKCWHRQHGMRAVEVAAYIDGRLKT